MCALLAVSALFAVCVNVFPSWTGSALLDGTLGIALGLYVCSYPAGAAIELLYLERAALQRLASEWSDVGWLLLNVLVLVTGCLVTIAGATRFVGRGPTG